MGFYHGPPSLRSFYTWDHRHSHRPLPRNKRPRKSGRNPENQTIMKSDEEELLTIALSVSPVTKPAVGEDDMMLTRLREVLINNYLAHGMPFLSPQGCQRNSGWESLDDVLSPIFPVSPFMTLIDTKSRLFVSLRS